MFLTPLLLALPALAAPDLTLTPHLQVRPRLEADTGKDGIADGERLAVSQRTRLGLTLGTPRLELHAALQDVRVWGTEADTLKDFAADAFDLHTGHLTWRPGDGVAVVVGRQELAFHEQRLLGAVDWAQQGRSFDAARVQGSSGDFSADVALAVLFEGDQVGPTTKDGTLTTLRAGRSADGLTTDVVALYQHLGEADTDRLTAGLYVAGGSGVLSGRVEAYGQVGSAGPAAIQAGMVGLRGTLSPEVGGAPEVTLWYDLLSGDGDATDDQATAFDTLYATNHKFYGLIDMVAFSVGGAADGRGLHDAALKASVAPTEGVRVLLDGHLFMAAASQGGEAVLGQEIDAWAKGRLAPGLVLAGGAAAFLPAAGEADLWGFVQLAAEL